MTLVRSIGHFGAALMAGTPDEPTGSEPSTDSTVDVSGLSAGDWIQAGVTFGVAIVVAMIAAAITRRLARSYNAMIATLLGRVVAGVFIVIGFVYALNEVGVAVGPLLGGLGIGGIALAFATRDVLGDVLAGVLIQIRRPFEIGHLVKLDGRLGRVRDVTLRAVEIDAVDDERVILPASNVLHNSIENWSTNGQRRADVIIGIPYDADIPDTIDRLYAAMQEVDGCEPGTEPMVLVDEFAGSSVNIRLLVWHDVERVHFLEFASRVSIAAKRCVNDAGLSVPFPIRTLDVPSDSPLAAAFDGARGRD